MTKNANNRIWKTQRVQSQSHLVTCEFSLYFVIYILLTIDYTASVLTHARLHTHHKVRSYSHLILPLNYPN